MSIQSTPKKSSAGSGRASIADVARMAGCAPVTVSRRLNDPKLVSPEVVKAIDEAIEALGYVRNESARALRSNRSLLVGAIIPTLRHSIYAEMLEGLQNTLAESGFALIHNTSDYDLDEEFTQARTLIERGVDALVLVGTRHRAKTFDLIKARNVTSVVTYALQSDFGLTSVGFDNRRAAAMAADRLLDLGHTRFAMIAGHTSNNDRARARVEGFVEAIAARGLKAEDVLVVEASYQIGEGRAAMEKILAQKPDVTAILCGSDILAIGALYECRRQNIEVPRRLSIVGFDNLEIAAYTDPPLSTLDVPAYEMGCEAANYIIKTEPGKQTIKKVELHVQFIERQTTGPAPDRRV
ncbi:MAG: substrate-binding domain-containing protein [Hyphomicrobiaceae bacterium]|nr:substrate-binding domain-containing protein [Hyphomicrobiaceae bacterium]